MRITVALCVLALVVICSAQNDGRYRPTPTRAAAGSGRYTGNTDGRYSGGSDGRYSGGNDGRYSGGNDGRYRPDSAGSYNYKYVNDAKDADKYKHVNNAYKGNKDNIPKYVGGNDKYQGGGQYKGSGNGQQSGSGASKKIGFGAGGAGGRFGSASSGSGINAGAGFGASKPLKKGDASGLYDNKNYAIIRKVEKVETDGYHYAYETANGITGEEHGKLYERGTDAEAMRAKGYYTYTGPDANVYTVNYTADENGFVPQADHLPTPPPIPELIQKMLDYQRAQGTL